MTETKNLSCYEIGILKSAETREGEAFGYHQEKLLKTIESGGALVIGNNCVVSPELAGSELADLIKSKPGSFRGALFSGGEYEMDGDSEVVHSSLIETIALGRISVINSDLENAVIENIEVISSTLHSYQFAGGAIRATTMKADG